MDRGVFESFSFNLTKSDDPEVQTEDKAMLEGSVSKDILKRGARDLPAAGQYKPCDKGYPAACGSAYPGEKGS
jgi:hypothetical protein